MEIYKNKLFKVNGLTTDPTTENPRVGGSIPSRPTSLTPFKLGFCLHNFGINPPLTGKKVKKF
jgi:hypothetical protein